MKPGDYRREYAAYHMAFERARFDYFSGAADELRLAPLADRYADLWTREAVAALERADDETPAQFETERAALRELLRAARLGYAEARAGDTARELGFCEAAAAVEDNSVRVPLDGVPEIIAREAEFERRRELLARWLDSLRACDDLRAAKLEALDDAARVLGFERHSLLLAESAEEDEDNLTAAVEVFLRQTEQAYQTGLAAWATRLQLDLRRLTYADELLFPRLEHLDRFFPARDLLATYRDALAGLGVRVERQPNLQIVALASPSVSFPAVACLPLSPPEDVRLLYRAQDDGALLYRDFFHEAGRAQHFAWASVSLAARYPELIRPPVARLTGEGHAFLFSYLLLDAKWIGEYRGVREVEARNIARAFALVELHNVRRCCAALRYERQSARTMNDPRSEVLSEFYETAHREATGFEHPAALRLFEINASAPAAAQLRARLFAAAAHEHFRTCYGRRWWASRAAGDELIDMWNTASRHTLEELAALIGFGALDIELLAESLLRALREG